MQRKRLLLIIVIFIIGITVVHAQDEGGGTTGADFLITPPVIRADGMGGVIDGLDGNLGSVPYNPALLGTLDDFSLQISMAPLPNEVSDTTLGVAIPLSFGVLGINGQLFNVGTFTEINNSGQPLNTYTILDAAVGASYAYAINEWVSVGGTLKGIYRGLGDYWGLSGAADIGTSLRFETPHIGQRPKAETYEQLEQQFAGEISDLDNEKNLKLAEAEDLLAAVEGALAKEQNKLVSMHEKLLPGMDAEKKTKLESEIAQQQGLVEEVSASLEKEMDNYSASLTEADSWYQDELVILNQAHAERVKSLEYIVEERSRLFSIIDDPAKGLTDDIIDSNINDLIERLSFFESEQFDSLTSAESKYISRRKNEITKVKEDIDRYEGLITEELGESRTVLLEQIESINDKINIRFDAESAAREELDKAKTSVAETKTFRDEASKALNALGDAGAGSAEESALQNAEVIYSDALQAESDSKEAFDIVVVENQEPLNSLNAELAAAKKELEILERDVWIQRLKTRIDEIETDIALMEKEIEEKQLLTDKSVEAIKEDVSIETESLESLRTTLKKDLKRSGLEKELALLDARNEKAAAKADTNYNLQVKEIYTRLLDTMYDLEERIFQAHIEAVNENNALKLFDLEKDSQKYLESLEDDFIFSRRLLVVKINDLKKEESPELAAVEEEFVILKDDFNQNIKNTKTETAEEKEVINNEKKTAVEKIKEEQGIIRLIYLQTDKPYKNTSFTVSVRNAGIPITFAEESYPLPLSIYTSFGYALLNIDHHRLSLSAMLEYSFYEPITFGFGSEYIFNDLIYVRAGYLFGKAGQSFSVGFGLKSKIGTSQYGADYGFKPIKDYGYIHSFGINAQF